MHKNKTNMKIKLHSILFVLKRNLTKNKYLNFGISVWFLFLFLYVLFYFVPHFWWCSYNFLKRLRWIDSWEHDFFFIFFQCDLLCFSFRLIFRSFSFIGLVCWILGLLILFSLHLHQSFVLQIKPIQIL